MHGASPLTQSSQTSDSVASVALFVKNMQTVVFHIEMQTRVTEPLNLDHYSNELLCSLLFALCMHIYHCIICIHLNFRTDSTDRSQIINVQVEQEGPQYWPLGHTHIIAKSGRQLVAQSDTLSSAFKVWFHPSQLGEKLNFDNFVMRISWLTVSKAFLRSRNTAPTTPPLSILDFTFFRRKQLAVSVECFAPKPNCMECNVKGVLLRWELFCYTLFSNLWHHR